MDSFFVEVERLDDRSLVGRPVAVGGRGPRGVIASASYEARGFGVRSAQPTANALRMCPTLEVVSPRHNRYGEVSAAVFAVFRSITPLVESLSVDEAFLDIGGLHRHYPSPVDVGHVVRELIREDLGLPCSVGVAATKFVAKLASEAAKPDGLRHVSIDDQTKFLHALPAESLWGVGPATLAGLERLGVSNVGEIAELPVATLTAALGHAVGRHLHELANGLDPRPVEPDSSAKSISVEQTYTHDLVGREVLQTALLAHAQRLSARLRRSGVGGRTITLKTRFEDFHTVTRSQTADAAVDGSRELYRMSLELLEQVAIEGPVRLLGLAATGLEDSSKPRQFNLEHSEEWERVEGAVADVQHRFGLSAVKPARLVDNRGPEEDQEPG